jgi:hypothetical protein
MHKQLKLLSSTVVENLYSSISENIERYQSHDFEDLRVSSGWEIETSLVSIEPSLGQRLIPSKSPEHEVKNSLIVYESLHGMTPALARDERVWTRLCHVECLNYARSRWVGEKDKEGDIRRHFFATGVRGCRDQNAIGRLWWNAHIASLAHPANMEESLSALLARANYRLQIIDRADTAFRQPLLSGILRLLEKHDWLLENDSAVAYFMYEVNKHSGSLVFEALSEKDIDGHLLNCISRGERRFLRKQ